MTEPSENSADLALSVGIVGIVVIGRNEGQRLIDCLASLPTGVPVIYVDSNSTDDSVANATAAGAEVVSLDMSIPFTAARARNEGADRLLEIAPELEAIQFLDGDTVLQPGWLAAATERLAADTDLVALAGRRRERYPDQSWYNRLCDFEWNTPIGQARAVGGDALYRVSSFVAAGKFNPSVIAGEEPELCFRLREQGGSIFRMDHEMTLHDAAIFSFKPFWKRAVRGGYAYCLGAIMHGASSERFKVRETLRALFWGLGLPAFAVLMLLFGKWWVTLGIIGLYGVKVARVGRRVSGRIDQPYRYAGFMVAANTAEAFGAVRCLIETVLKRDRQIIEYK